MKKRNMFFLNYFLFCPGKCYSIPLILPLLRNKFRFCLKFNQRLALTLLANIKDRSIKHS